MGVLTIPSPIGELTIVVDEEERLTRIDFETIDFPTHERATTKERGLMARPLTEPSSIGCFKVARQLEEYFARQRRAFDLELSPQGTGFQQVVWKELTRIPYGATCSYRDVAHRIGKPEAVRAVGKANGSNPIPIIIPCHRVIGADGSLTGYGGGLSIKKTLLKLEQAQFEILM